MITGTKLLFTLWKISVQKQILLSWLLLPLQLKIFGFPLAFLEGDVSNSTFNIDLYEIQAGI